MRGTTTALAFVSATQAPAVTLLHFHTVGDGFQDAPEPEFAGVALELGERLGLERADRRADGVRLDADDDRHIAVIVAAAEEGLDCNLQILELLVGQLEPRSQTRRQRDAQPDESPPAPAERA